MKTMPKKTEIPKAVSQFMAEMGRKGGKSKSSAGGQAVWANLTPLQRSKEMKRRAAVRAKNKEAQRNEAQPTRPKWPEAA
ncbi:MAG: hypothetical protein H8E27_01680 [Verrucomicrobia subdivision 3 bacterium]|nr:hypothetical protein [Limisphaerales bacterium]